MPVVVWDANTGGRILDQLMKQFMMVQIIQDLRNFKLKKYTVYNFSEEEIILPTCYENLSEIYNGDEWNYQISLEIIEYFFKNKFTIIKKKNNSISNKINKIKKKVSVKIPC